MENVKFITFDEVVLYNPSTPLSPTAINSTKSASLGSLTGIKKIGVLGKVGDNAFTSYFIPLINAARNSITITSYTGDVYYIEVWIFVDTNSTGNTINIECRGIGSSWGVSNLASFAQIKKVIGYYTY